ncbi:hypothetical protein TKK_0014637 [Trichogramma kaykai]
MIPIGLLSEEARECNNKNIKEFKLPHIRKIFRKATNFDTFHRLLCSSDPFITLTKELPKKKFLSLTAEMKSLLVLDGHSEEASEDFVLETDRSDENDTDSETETSDLDEDSDMEEEEKEEEEEEEEEEDSNMESDSSVENCSDDDV